jgi:hypothetical protein
MREVRISCGFLAFPADRGKALAFGNGLNYFALVFNGSRRLEAARRDKRATWTPPAIRKICRFDMAQPVSSKPADVTIIIAM